MYLADSYSNNFKNFDSAVSFLSPRLKDSLLTLNDDTKKEACEVRVRVGQKLQVICKNKSITVPVKNFAEQNVDKFDIKESFNALCRYSVYSFQTQICQGFITYGAGHRVGICGTAVVENGNISNIRNITSLNIRIARQAIGCAKDIFNCIRQSLGGVLIVGKPSSGKTTAIRDLAQLLSLKTDSEIQNVVIADERNEIAAACEGVLNFDVGLSDVLTSYPKKDAVLHALRCMNPNWIICDEIGTEEDVESLNCCTNAGVKVVATMHAGSLGELLLRPQFNKIQKTHAFEKIIFLDEKFKISGKFDVYDMEKIYD